jgi:hypothetical protein
VRELLVVILIMTACRQGAGGRCQFRSDCDEGLACILPATFVCPPQFPTCTPCLIGGTCQPESRSPLCESSAECAPGSMCLAATSCAEQGLHVCVPHPDLSIAIADLAVDLSPPETD